MDGLAQLLTSLGVSAPAGFNAYLALLLVGLGNRAGWVQLTSPYDILASTPALILLTVLLSVELVADKIPALDSVNDAVGTVVRPLSGAVLFAGTNQVLTGDMPWASLLLGGGAAGALHAFKAMTRPVWTVTTGGMANPVVSFIEDLIAGATVVTAFFAPAIALLFLLILLGLTSTLLLRLRRAVRGRTGRASVLR